MTTFNFDILFFWCKKIGIHGCREPKSSSFGFPKGPNFSKFKCTVIFSLVFTCAVVNHNGKQKIN